MTGGSHLSMSHPPAAREPSRPAGLVSLHPELAPQPLIDQRTAPSDVFYLLNNKVCERWTDGKTPPLICLILGMPL